MTPQSIILLDSEALVRTAMRNLIHTIGGYQVIAETECVEEGLALTETLQPNLALVEMTLSGRSGIDFILEAKKRKLPTTVIALAHFDNVHTVNNALCAGAKGFISKCCSPQELERGLRIVTTTEQTYLPDKISALIEQQKKSKNSNGHCEKTPLDILSIREKEVFYLLADGLQNTVIAKKLFISPRTVETHRARIVKKLGVKSNGELIRFAIKHGLTVV